MARLAGLRCPSEVGAVTWGDVNWDPSHVVAKWLGYSPKVAAQHYLMSREHHFDDVVRGDSAGAADGGQTGVPGCDANCDAKCDSAGVRARSHEAA